METKIVLQVRGIDLEDDETLEAIAQHLDDLGWESAGGIVTAVLYTESSNPIAAAVAAAQNIQKVVPGCMVVRADDQLVSIGDIADRLGVTSEAVRLWSAGKRRAEMRPFPSAHAVVSQRRTMMKLWTWGEVLEWLRAEYRLDPEQDVRYLSADDIARLNVELGRRTPGSVSWQSVAGAGCDRVLARVDEALATAATSAASARKVARFSLR